MDGEHLYYAFLAGAREVIKEKNYLNKINVFPVPDGDTGTNLAVTMNWIMKNANMRASAVETFKSIADAALTGARGNSGTIFAQYINGVTMELQEERTLTVKSFSESVREGVRHAYEAIENPVEGTMLSVIRDWAGAIYDKKDQTKDFIELLTEGLKQAKKSLQETTYKLQALKSRGIVDSGAKGFVSFLEGFLNYIRTGNKEGLKEEEVAFEDTFEDIHPEDLADITFRYCTEGLIEGEHIHLTSLKQEIKGLGDSLIVAGNNRKVKVHVHTNEPAKVFEILDRYGTILEQKAEDMVRQNQLITQRKYNIALVTDSIADIPQSLIDDYQIHQLALPVHIGKTTYFDKLTMHATGMYDILKSTTDKPASSQPTVKSIKSLLMHLSDYYDAIIVVSVSSKMSGTYQRFMQVAKELKEKQITVIDSKVNSGAQGLVVLKAAEAIAKGNTYEEVVDITKKAASQSQIYVSVSTLQGMIRGGRISPVLGRLGEWLGLKPIVSIDQEGKGVPIGKAFTIKENTKQIYKLVRKIQEEKDISRYVIVHGKGESRVSVFAKELTQLIGKEPEYIEEISSIVAMSAGENTVAVALLTEERG